MLDPLIKRIPNRLKEYRWAVVMGGESPEREVSLHSGTRVLKSMKNLNLEVKATEFDLNLPVFLRDNKINAVFLATHGVPGEDGSVQGLLDALNIPYTGAGVAGSALAMNKMATKTWLEKLGIATPAFAPFDQSQALEVIVHDLAENIAFPLMLKPNFGGSSIGIRLAQNMPELRTALETLLPDHDHLFAERYIPGKEITVSILEDSRSKPYALPILELQPKHFFYDYECKTLQGKTDFLIPADIPNNLAELAVEWSIRAHEGLEMRDFSRSDFMISESNELFYLETNSIPGMTDLSDLPAQARAYGMSFEEVVVSLISGISRRGS